MATTTKSEPSTADRKKLAQQVSKLKSSGKGWPEIMKATGVAGPATGRKLLREFNLGDGINQKATPKKASPKTEAKRQRSRGNKPRTSNGSASPVTTRVDKTIVKGA